MRGGEVYTHDRLSFTYGTVSGWKLDHFFGHDETAVEAYGYGHLYSDSGDNGYSCSRYWTN